MVCFWLNSLLYFNENRQGSTLNIHPYLSAMVNYTCPMKFQVNQIIILRIAFSVSIKWQMCNYMSPLKFQVNQIIILRITFSVTIKWQMTTGQLHEPHKIPGKPDRLLLELPWSSFFRNHNHQHILNLDLLLLHQFQDFDSAKQQNVSWNFIYCHQGFDYAEEQNMAFKMSSFAETMALGYLKSQVMKMEFICVDGIRF